MKTLKPCIVTFIDMIGVRALLDAGSSEAVSIMRRMHSVVPRMANQFSSNTEICFWNDSVLIHTPVDGSVESYEEAMRPLSTLKAAVDKIHKSYAICIKGMSFQAPPGSSSSNSARLVFLSASSLAFANCDRVHKHLKNFRMDWYIDRRIIVNIKHSISRNEDDKKKVRGLYPKGSDRTFYMFRGSFVRQH